MKDQFIKLLETAFEKEENSISFTDKFREYPEWDSLARLSLIAMLDDEFEVHIEDKVFKSLITVDELYQEVLKRRPAN